MMLSIHGFDWGIYNSRIMPAFARWLIHADETSVQQLYQETRCAREEQFVPLMMHPLNSWRRAQEQVEHLPRGPFARREYQKLCSAEPFTALSDRYVQRHPPQLFQVSDALRTIWGALVEEYCLPWLHLDEQDQEQQSSPTIDTPTSIQPTQYTHQELISLLHSAGMNELAEEVHLQSQQAAETTEEQLDEPAEDEEDLAEDEDEDEDRTQGIALGRAPAPLHLRGWLASISVRAMALFELLACGRRTMPFGYEPSEPYGSSIGYLTPTEVWQLALCLRDITIPDQETALKDYEYFRAQHVRKNQTFRMIDEVQPSHAQPFTKAVRIAAMQGLGLLCRLG